MKRAGPTPDRTVRHIGALGDSMQSLGRAFEVRPLAVRSRAAFNVFFGAAGSCP